MTGTMLDAALEYSQRYNLPIFPVWGVSNGCCRCGKIECEHPGKHPLGRLVPHAFKEATTDEATIRKWWGSEPEANIGTPTADRVVLDVDPRHGGDKAVDALVQQYGSLPATPEIITGGGGRHVHFAKPSISIGNSAGRLGPGLDIKTDGGYVLLPPSTHISGGVYRDDPDHPLFEVPLAPIPQWMLNRLTAAEPPAHPTNGQPPTHGWAALLAGCPKGQRHIVAARIAGHYLGMKIPAAEVEQILLGFAGRCTPPLPASEARRTVQDLAKRDATRKAADGTLVSYQPGVEAPPIEVEAAVSSVPDPPYSFEPVFPPNHFVGQFIAYGAGCTDAALEFFEALAVLLLAMVTPNMRARLRPYPGGLPTAFYLILVGDSTTSRKSSSAGLARALLERVLPDASLAEQASPEAFVEQLAGRSRQGSLWYLDEIGETFEKLEHAKYLSGLRGLLLSLYEGGNYHYKRTSKRNKKGEREADELVIEDPHLCVLGLTTPAVFEVITSRDIRSGFLARFAIVMPTAKPPRRPIGEDSDDFGMQRNVLSKWLHEIWTWAQTGPRRVAFVGNALAVIDRLAEEIESSSLVDDERSRAMLQRLNALTIKLAMLAAVGRPGATESDALKVNPEDAQWAVAVARRWLTYAVTFGKQVGETEIERLIDRALRIVRRKKRVHRRVVAQNVHTTKRIMDDIEATLVDRGEIKVARIEMPGRPATGIWEDLR